MSVGLQFVISNSLISTRNLHIAHIRKFWAGIQLASLFTMLIYFLSSCNGHDNTLQDQLYGRWDISKAERNGKETSYLRGGYFIIDQNGTMTINITGADEKGPYTMDKKKLKMGDKNFEIREIKNDSMILKYIPAPKIEFLFYMHKKK